MATELGQAYVQIMPSAKGISGMIQKQLNPEADSAGESVGSRIGAGFKVALAASAAAAGAVMVKTISTSLAEGSKLQQSLGGIETLFKGSADKVKQYANQAYRTSGLSANEYMENVTSFSASLLQSVGGNTAKAADSANMAMVDMSDNANKMGTNIGDIQNAYQGFAKQNYTMLDNLKLGYGGTGDEMKRLLKDAQKITGVKYNISNLNDVYSAIHAIQGKLNITGTTAREAATTFSGSFDSMKSAAQNVMGKLSLGMDIGPDLKALAQTTSTFLFQNFIPMVGNIIKGIPGAVSGFISAAGPAMMAQGKQLFTSLTAGMSGGDMSAITASFTGIINTVKTTFASLDFSGITALGQQILPALQLGFQTFMGIAGPAINGVVTAFGNLWNAAQPIVAIIAQNLAPTFQILGGYLGGVFSGVMTGISTVFNVLASVLRFIKPLLDLLSQGLHAIAPAATVVATWIGKLAGLFGGLGGAASSLRSLATSAWNGIKSAVMVAGSGIKATIAIIKGIFSSLGSAGAGLKAALSGAWNGIVGVVRVARATISGVVGSIKSIFSGLGNISLRGAGEAIMNGFIGGLKSVWEAGKKFVGGIADWIKKHKGPISYDAKLLVPAGNAIMAGLNQGLTNSFASVQKSVGSMTAEIAASAAAGIGSNSFSVVSGFAGNAGQTVTRAGGNTDTSSSDDDEHSITQPIVIQVSANIDGKPLARKIAPDVRVELNRIDKTNQRRKGRP